MKSLIEKRRTLLKSSLTVTVELMEKSYQSEMKVLDNFLDICDIRFDDFLPERNYRIMAMAKSDSY